MGKGNNTTSTQTAPNPEAMAAYQSLLQRANAVGDMPYTPYSGALTAGINDQQRMGFAGINQNANFASPFIQQGAQYANQVGQGPTQANLDPYMNPFQQNVIDATQAQFNRSNAQQQNDLRGRAASQGALGGSRANVAAGDLAYQQQQGQAPAIANLYAQNYGQAVNNWGQNARFASGQMGNLGVSGQQAGLAGAGAQVGAGSLQQQTEQQRLSALYNQFQIAQAFPYQQTQWLAGLQTGVGSQMGGTSSTTQPPPNPWNTVAGLGMIGASFIPGVGPIAAAGMGAAGAGMMRAASGGVVGYAGGGAPDDSQGVSGSPFAGIGFIPGLNITHGAGAPPPPHPTQHHAGSPINPMAFSRGSNSNSGVSGAPSWWSPAPQEESPDVWQGPPSASEVYRSGGVVRGYADGGSPFDDEIDAPPLAYASDDLSFNDRFAPAYGGVKAGKFDISGGRTPNLPEPGTADAVPLPRSRPEMAGVAGSPPTSDGSGWEPAPREGAPGEWQGATSVAPLAGPRSAERSGFIPNDLRAPLFAAGAAMMASRSPHFGVALGEGALTGFGAYQHGKEKAEDRSIRKQSLDMQSRRLDQAAETAKQRIAEQTRYHDILDRSRRDALETRQDAAERSKYQRTDMTAPDGTPLSFDARTGKYINSATGEPIAADVKPVNPKAEGAFSNDAVEIGGRQLAQGDLSPLTNVGRGAQAGQNIARLRNKAAEVLVAQGMTPAQAADYLAIQTQRFKAQGMAQGAAARTAGTRLANLGIIIEATDAAVPAAVEASEKVARTGWVPINQVIQKGQVIASNPDLRVFGMANLQLAEHWARAMNPTGVMRESDRDLALNFLSTADSPDTYKRVVQQLQTQIHRERGGVEKYGEQWGVGKIRRPGSEEGEAGPSAAPAASPKGGATDQSARALDWANKNPNDPRAAEIKKRLGVH